MESMSRQRDSGRLVTARTAVTVLAALGIVIVVVAGAVAVAFAFGFQAKYDALGGWGAWSGLFVSGLALLGTSYAVILQTRNVETTSWSIALSRLGTLYDLALANSDFAQILTETSGGDSDPQPLYPPYTLTAEQRVWLGSLFLAYEQIYVATLSLSDEARRVWRIYIANQLNKPSIRAQFCRDAVAALDYHNEFWRFVRGTARLEYRDGAIASRFFDRYRAEAIVVEYPAEPLDLTAGLLTAKPLTETDLPFWLELYTDPEVRHQMYAAPTGSMEEFKAFLRKRTLFTVFEGSDRVGGFSITREGEFMGTFGFLVHRDFRGRGYGELLVTMLEEQAARMKLRTLRADVYDDNAASIKTLEKHDFRRFIWMEKNLPT